MTDEPKVLLFDVMGTLVHDPFFVEIPEFFGLTLQELFAQKHPSSWLDFEHGLIDERTYFTRMFADGREFDHNGFRAHLKASYRWLPGMRELLFDLSGRYELHALSNYPTWFEYIEAELQLSRYLTWSFVSCKMGVRKPESSIYQRAAAQVGRPPEQCIFVDDRKTNCDAAHKVGMTAIVFSDAQTCIDELRTHGVFVS